MKLGTAQDRAAVAAYAREQRNRYPSLAGSWTYHQWVRQVAEAAQNRLAVLTRKRRMSLADMSPAMRQEYEAGQAIAQKELRSPLRARDLLSAQDEQK